MAAGFDGSIRIDTKLDAKGVNTGLAGITKSLKTLGAAVGIVFGVEALLNFGKAAISVASDLEEVQNVVNVTFKEMSESINGFADTALKQFGLSELSAKKYTSTMGAMLKSSGFGTKAAAEMSIEMAKLTADMASFYNLDTDTAFEKIRSGISGETEPLKALGINLNVANLEAFALSQGITKSYNAMSQSEQVMLRYNYLLNASADAQGDFARNSGTWANQVKMLTEKWKEFSALIGKALIEFLLPVVEFLNKTLDILIGITKEIGKIYTLLTGKEVVVEANNAIVGSAEDAAESESDLSDSIKNAGKEAKKALAPFDELNVLQNNLGDGIGGTGDSNFGTIFDTKLVSDGLITAWKKTEDEGDEFYAWYTNWLTALRSAALIPIPSPMFEPLQSPIYRPEWGLVPPLVPLPDFPKLKEPIYDPQWGLVPPLIPEPIFPSLEVPIFEPVWGLEYPALQPLAIPALDMSGYMESLGAIRLRTLEGWEAIGQITGVAVSVIGQVIKEKGQEITKGLKTGWETIESNYAKHKENIGILTSGIASVLVLNMNQGLSVFGANVNNALTAVQGGMQAFGKNVGSIAAGTATAFANNISEGFRVTSQNLVTFANSMGSNLKTFGVGVLATAAETAKGFVNNMVSGFVAVWNNFKNLMSGIGEKLSGWYSEHKQLVTTTAIVGGVVGLGALAVLAAPATVGYAAAGMLALAAIPNLKSPSIPRLATGAVIPPNGEFLAVLGDQRSGRNLEAPEGLIRKIVREESGNSETVALLRELVSAVREGKVLMVDRQVLGKIVNKSQSDSFRMAGSTIIPI